MAMSNGLLALINAAFMGYWIAQGSAAWAAVNACALGISLTVCAYLIIDSIEP